MAGGANKKIAKLTIFILTQDLLPAHWNWTPSELQSLNDSASMAKIILKRLQDAGLEVIEAHIIVHDKDEVELWDEYENECKIKLTSSIYISYDYLLLGKHTVKRFSCFGGGQPASAGSVVLISMYSAILRNSSANLK